MKMVKTSDFLKLILVIQLVELCCAVPLSEEANYESGVSVRERCREKSTVGIIIGFVHSMIRKLQAGFLYQLPTWRHQCILITLSRDIQDTMSA